MWSIIIPVGVVLVGLILFFCLTYRVAPVDKALIVTGGKKPDIRVSGGRFVIPIFRKASYFDLCMITISASGDEVKTKTSIPIVIDWTAQIRPDRRKPEALEQAIVSFMERGPKGIEEDVAKTLTGAVFGVAASMTPLEVQCDKESFKNMIVQTTEDELSNMGLELVSLNIQDVTDSYGYFDSIAALDSEQKRKDAEKVRAVVEQEIREQTAQSERVAKQAELESELEIAEREKENSLKKSAFKVETDKARADAEVAGQIQRTVREQEIAAQQGQIEVVRQEQANRAAIEEKKVLVTRAQAKKEQDQINAEAGANVKKIQAEAAVQVAEKDAEAVKIAAKAHADKVRQEGAAEAEVISTKGQAEAEVIKSRGLAEAEAEKAKLLAQAEGEAAIAEARASNDKVNFEIEKIKIENETRVQIATSVATIMAEVGKNAEFVNIGGSAPGSSGNVLVDTLRSIPSLMKTLDVENQALNGKSYNDEVSGIVGSLFGPVKGVLSNETHVHNATSDEVKEGIVVESEEIPTED